MSETKPLNLEEVDIRKAFEEWYFSRDFVPHGSMITNLCYQGFKKGIEYMKQHIKSACEFYQRYEGKPKLLVKEHYHLLKEMEDDDIWAFTLLLTVPDLEIKINEYNKWLFKLAFRDVFYSHVV